MSDDPPPTHDTVPNLAFVHLRRVEERLISLADIVIRQGELIQRLDRKIDEGFARLDRDLREVKSDLVTHENRVLTQTQRILNEVARLEDLALT